jgi:hypothetical protein
VTFERIRVRLSTRLLTSTWLHTQVLERSHLRTCSSDRFESTGWVLGLRHESYYTRAIALRFVSQAILLVLLSFPAILATAAVDRSSTFQRTEFSWTTHCQARVRGTRTFLGRQKRIAVHKHFLG